MKTIHRLLTTYTLIVAMFVIMFATVVYTTQPTRTDIFSMVLSIAMFTLIPFGIIFIIWKHHKC
jgi:hypothetical protein